MNTKGNTQQEARRLLKYADVEKTLDYMVKLKVTPLSTPLSANPPAAKAASPQMRGEHANLGGGELEEAMYPIEFLNAMNETAFKALEDWLIAQQAPKAVIGLLEDVNVLATWKDEVEHSDGSVGRHVNMFLQDTISSLTRHVAEIGGVFHAPYGTTVRRG